MLIKPSFRAVLYTLLLLLLYADLQSQPKQVEEFRISTTPTQYVFLEFPFIIEKTFKTNTLGLLLAYRPSIKSSGEVSGITGLGGEYIYQNYWNYLYNGVTAGFVAKHYFSEKRTTFLEADLFYRFWWFSNKHASYDNVEGYHFEGTRTERQHLAGLKLLLGSSKVIHTESRFKPVLDTYVGIGVRYKYYQFETVDGFVGYQYYDYKKDQGNLWLPSIHLGVRMGLNIYQQNSN